MLIPARLSRITTRTERYLEMSGEELFAITEEAGLQMGAEATQKRENMTAKLGEPINAECPLKPGRAIDPTLKALNEKGKHRLLLPLLLESIQG